MGKASKQADRKEAKKAAKKEDEDAGAPSTGTLWMAPVERGQALFAGSCLASVLPEMKELLSGAATNGKSEEPKDDKPVTGDGETEGDSGAGDGAPDAQATEKESGGDTAAKLFSSMCGQLPLFNVLGLAEPKDAEAAKQAWLDLKGLEVDFGPRSRKRGTPAADRIVENITNNMPQYLHVLLVLMMLRALLFRSKLACLPWLVFYQIVSIFVPLDGIPQLPQVPIEKCPVKFRVAGTMAIHSLVWLFFLLEFVYRTYFLEKFLIIGLIMYHAYAVRPAEK